MGFTRELRRGVVGGIAVAIAAGILPGLALAQVDSLPNGPVNCAGAVRSPSGAWTITQPMTIQTEQGPLNIAPGTTFGPGFFIGRVEPTAIFNRNCGNL